MIRLIYTYTFLSVWEYLFCLKALRVCNVIILGEVIYFHYSVKPKFLTIAILAAVLGISPAVCATSSTSPLTAAKEAYETAVRFHLKKDYQNAIAAYTIAGHLEPNHPAIFGQMGRVYFDQGDLEKAQIMFEKTLKLDPLYPDAHFMLGKVYKEQKLYEKAIDEMDRYLQLPTNADDRAEAESIKAECEELSMPR
jgi:tetratricopeptide (TPR) repeat protein